MNFDKNFGILRNRANMSQEALAEKLNVSRQTIYKWETGQTYPDTDKLNEIAMLFDVSVDSLLNELDDEIEFTRDEIISKFRNFGLTIGLSVMAILFSVSIFLIIGEIMSFKNNETIGLIVMLSIIFLSVIAIIIGGMSMDNFKKENLSIQFTKKEIRRARKRFTTFLVSGILSIFVGIVVMLCMVLGSGKLACAGVCILLALIGIGVMIIIVSSIVYELYDDPEKALQSDDKRPRKKTDSIPAVIMLLAVIVYLILALGFDGWDYGWLAFPIGGILCGISAVIFGDEEKKNKEKEVSKEE